MHYASYHGHMAREGSVANLQAFMKDKPDLDACYLARFSPSQNAVVVSQMQRGGSEL